MNVIGKYIYGIINSNTAMRLFVPRNFFGEKECENKNKIVYTISYQDISAVVSDSEIVDYPYMLKDVLAKLLVEHQKVIERIMNAEYTIIPMRLGTFAVHESEVRHILAKGYFIIKDIFNKIKDKIEIDMVATWSDFNAVLKEVAEERDVKEFKLSLLNKKEGITVNDQMKIGVMVKKALDEKREKYSEEIQNTLRTVSQDFRVHELMDDKMVANIAFLINKFMQEDFQKRIEELNNRFAEKLYFRCVGPLPPYSFYTLEIKRIQFKDLDWARKKLGFLNDSATKSEIKKVRQMLACSLHPDRNPNKPGIEREFDEVTKAYKVLLEYCQAAEQASQGERCSFNEKEFKRNALLVKVRE